MLFTLVQTKTEMRSVTLTEYFMFPDEEISHIQDVISSQFDT